MIKRAMIMAAGVGSRLGYLSNVIPKPLVPLANIPAMDILIKHLSSFGINDIISNTYFKADYIIEHYKNFDKKLNIQFIKEESLSGTAGGVKKCQFFFNEKEDFIVMSGDGLTNIDIKKAYESHKASGAIATIVVHEVEQKEVSKYGIIVPDENGYVKSFQEKPAENEAKSRLANTGIYIFNYDIYKYIPENTFYDFAKNVFPSILSDNMKINTYKHDGYWSDVGSIDQYKQSNIDIINNKVPVVTPQIKSSGDGKYVAGKNTKISPSSKLKGINIIGNNCEIEENCQIINSIIWDNVKIEESITIENSIILSDSIVNKSTKNDIIYQEKENLQTV